MRVGVFGGTFDPIHLGHMKAAYAFFEQMSLDRLIVMPDRIPPHKAARENDDPMHRFRMAELAFADPMFEGKATVSDMELRREGKSYTYDTLLALRDMGYDDIYLYCGTDMLLTLDEWHCPRELLALCTVAYAAREHQDGEFRQKVEGKMGLLRGEYGAQIEKIVLSPFEISSTALREMIKNGGDVSSYLPPAVDLYIKENHLYR